MVLYQAMPLIRTQQLFSRPIYSLEKLFSSLDGPLLRTFTSIFLLQVVYMSEPFQKHAHNRQRALRGVENCNSSRVGNVLLQNNTSVITCAWAPLPQTRIHDWNLEHTTKLFSCSNTFVT